MQRDHAKLSASGAVRWMHCAGSIRAEAALPKSTSSYAEQGTAAHDLAERCLREDVTADYFGGQTFNGYEADNEMVETVQIYLDYARNLDGKSYVEQRVDYSPWVPEGFGTSDFTCIRDGVCTVVDLKYGAGVKVHSENNPQAMLYGLGALNEFGFLYECDEFKLVIVQPRMDHISEWTISREDLLEFGEHARACAELALADDAPLVPSTKACQFCRARGSCRALAEHNFALAVEDFEATGDPIELKNPDQLTTEELAKLLTDIEILSGWAAAVKSHAHDTIMRGGAIPGFKLVEGQSSRKWSDEEAAGKALARKLTAKVAYIRKTITITEAEKHLGKKNPLIDKYTTKPPGKPTLAPENSPKPALEFALGADFDDLDEAA